MSEFHLLPISEIERETPNAVCITFDIPTQLTDTFAFKAGQYITLKAQLNGKEVRRAYSLCSSPKSGTWSVGVKKVEDGTFSVYANDVLNVGDSLEVMAPQGHFVFEPQTEESKHYAAFAAGSGITPVLSIVKDVLEREPQSRFALVYGNKSKEETMFWEALEDLKQQYPDRLIVEYIFSQSEEKNAMRGRIDRSVVNYLLKNKFQDYNFDSYYLCGPEAMIDTVTQTLQDRGVSKESILFELFTSSDEGELTESHEGTTEITVIVDDETETFTMSKEESVLDAALDKDLDPPYSCQGGICSSCIARVKEGKVEMRKNQILTDSELEEGLILTCQSHPTTPKLVVDYDDV
ncbi:ferredoxin--NADP reductase [Aureisphaera galaxeae]|uniref:ferredoxin--NADP reductase n=1 Tax=Aureisphaera galaxeae TaxID=1538023 RepID=UPI00235098E6|nr:ferredoxin--NADP reductase [Aureisphaera galaxeae]MDC8005058.1 ferredoxin--NADP reductase [Aureisphaera galaxeae]